jgi:predicted permease
MREAIERQGRNLRHAFRALRRAPGFTSMAVGMLGLAIGANAAIFSVVNKVLVEPLPFLNPDRLVYIAASAPGSDMAAEFGVGPEFVVHYKEHSTLLEDVAVWNAFTSTMRAGDRVERISMSWPTSNLFTTLGVAPLIGRLPVADDDDRVAVLSHGLWMSWFGGDPNVLGQSFFIANGPKTVVGVMPPTFKFPNDSTLVWISNRIQTNVDVKPGNLGIPLVGRMKPGATVEAVAAELTALSKRLPERFGGTASYVRLIQQHRAVVRPLEDELVGGIERALWVLFAACGIVLLIACANVANLFMVRAEGRQRDLAVRRAIGATRGHLVGVQMSEAIVVAALSGGVAVLFASVLLPVFLQAAPSGIRRLAEVRVTGQTLIFTLGTAALAALACGAVPALRASAGHFARLRDGSRGATRGRRWARDGLVVAQTALALVLLIGSGLLVRSFWALRNVDPGYETADIFTFQIAPQRPSLSDGPSWARFHLDFMERLRALPGVQTVGLVENIPLDEGTGSSRYRGEPMAGRPAAEPNLQFTYAAGDYFQAMDIALVAGRTFSNDDQLSGASTVVISASAAAALWPGEDAIGRRLQRESASSWNHVIGVVEDVKQYEFRDSGSALVYYPMVGPTPESWALASPAYVVKTPRAETIAPEVRSLVQQLAPEAPMYRVYTMAELSSRSMTDLSFTMLTLGVASTLALVLGVFGLYGVLSFVVAERTREIGVRLALGARTHQVLRMVIAEGVRVVIVGVAVGVGVSLWITRALSALLFGVTAVDGSTFTIMSTAMVAVGIFASYVPARRASKVDPIVSLRLE